MTFMQKHKILQIRSHFETKFDEAFVKIHTMTKHGPSDLDRMQTALTLAYSQGVLKAIDLILIELGP